jgi:GNAT superfamily N-acetyltransferase
MNDRVCSVAPRQDADASLEVRRGTQVVARASLWWSNTPRLDGAAVGFLGDYASDDARAAAPLLAAASRRLRGAGCALAVGPVDGSTWKRYRFVTTRGERAPFLLEPDNPDAYPDHFRAAGFAALAHYFSAEEVLRDERDARARRSAVRLRANGVTIRPFDPARWDSELDAMYGVACDAFASSLLFSPIERAAFHRLYAPLRDHIDPDFVRIAEHEGRAVGFAFGVIDDSNDGRDERGTTLVGKTQARLADRRYAGLGAVMLDDVRQRAYERGVRRLVHALIREDNHARNATTRVASVFRRYSLFARSLI